VLVGHGFGGLAEDGRNKARGGKYENLPVKIFQVQSFDLASKPNVKWHDDITASGSVNYAG
jgi:hypothetical protein